MSLTTRFKNLFRVESKSTLASPDNGLLALFGAQSSASGIAVTPRSAMTCAPVRCAVASIAEPIGQLPVHVYRRKEDGSKERAPDHPAYKLLHDEANEWTPASSLREQLTRDALLEIGGFAFINRADGKPVELIRLEPSRMEVTATDFGEPKYLYAIDGGKEKREFNWRDVLHIPSPALPGSTLIRDGREAIGLALVMEKHAANLFGRGARPSGVLKFQKTLGAEAAARIKSAWQAAHGGNASSGGTAVLEEGGEWQALTLNSVDAQFLEMRAFSVAEIARLFRVPPIFLQDYGRATWGNSEQMGQQFLTFTLLPWIKRWEGELRLKLFTEEDRKTYFAEFLTDDLLRADFETRMEGYAKAIAARVLNPNEARAAENRPPYAGGDKFENPNTAAAGSKPEALANAA